MLHVQVSSCHCLHCSLSWTAEPGRLRFWLRQAVMETSSRMLGFKQFADKGRARAQESLCCRRPRLADWKLRADLHSALEKWLSPPQLHVCRLNCIIESLIKCWAAELWEVPWRLVLQSPDCLWKVPFLQCHSFSGDGWRWCIDVYCFLQTQRFIRHHHGLHGWDGPDNKTRVWGKSKSCRR